MMIELTAADTVYMPPSEQRARYLARHPISRPRMQEYAPPPKGIISAPAPKVRPLVRPLVRPPTLEARLREVDALRGKLPWNSIRKMINCINGSAQDCGENIPELYEPRPQIAVPGKPTISEIQKFAAHYFAITQSDILSARRTANVRRPRHIAIYLSRLLTARSLNEIGRKFGGRHHTTVLMSVRKIADLVTTDGTLSEEIASLKEMLLS